MSPDLRAAQEPQEGPRPCPRPTSLPHTPGKLCPRTATVHLCFLKPRGVIWYSGHRKQVERFLGHISYISTLDVVLKLNCCYAYQSRRPH